MYRITQHRDRIVLLLEEVEQKLNKFDWISSYEIFIQQIERFEGLKETSDAILINKKSRSGVALRLFT